MTGRQGLTNLDKIGMAAAAICEKKRLAVATTSGTAGHVSLSISVFMPN
jgi:hypothetical protein